MKKVFTTIAGFALIVVAGAQNVGIGTLVPSASAALHIQSSNKGVLFPNVFLAATVDNNSIPAPASSLIVFNTNPAMTGGKGLFYNSGTSQSANWAKVGEITFPYSGATSAPSYAFYIQNYHLNTSSSALKAFCQNGYAIHAASGAGVGVYTTSATGNALEVSGRIKIDGTGQAPAPGKVLTSDANGMATWEGGIAFSSSNIQPDGASEFAHNQEKKVSFYTEDYDVGNNYNNAAGSPYSTFTAPVKGIYHFDVKTVWEYDYSTGTSILTLKKTYNGATSEVSSDVIMISYSLAQHSINKDVLLEAGTQVFVTLFQNSGSTVALVPNGVGGRRFAYFTGRLVMRL